MLFGHDLADRFPEEATRLLGGLVRDAPPSARNQLGYRTAIEIIGEVALEEGVDYISPLIGDSSLSGETLFSLGAALALIRGERARKALETLRASAQWSFPGHEDVDRRIERILAAKMRPENAGP